MLSENLDPSIVFDPRDEEGSRIGDLLKPTQIIVAFVEGVDAVRHDDNILLGSSNIGHLSVAHQPETRDIAREIKFRVEFDRLLVFPVVRQVILGQTQVDGRAVDDAKRIMKFEPVSRRTGDGSVKDFLE